MEFSKAALLVAAVGFACLFAPNTEAAPLDVFLSDTFDNQVPASAYAGNPAGTGDYGVNQELATRQSGLVGPVTYNTRDPSVQPGPLGTQVNPEDMPGVLALYTLDRFNPYVLPTHGFGSDLHLSVLVDPAVGDTQGGDWVSISVRGKVANYDGFPWMVPGSSDSGVSLLVKSNGTWAVVANGDLTPGNVVRGVVASAGEYFVELNVEGDKLTGAINGTLIGEMTLTGAAATGGDFNYVAISAYAPVAAEASHSVEGLVVSESHVIVPEPATLAFVGLGACLILLRRKRR